MGARVRLGPERTGTPFRSFSWQPERRSGPFSRCEVPDLDVLLLQPRSKHSNKLENAHFESQKMKIFWASADLMGRGTPVPILHPIYSRPVTAVPLFLRLRRSTCPQTQMLDLPLVAFANLLLKFVPPARLCTRILISVLHVCVSFLE